MDTSKAFPVDWNEWRAEWTAYRADLGERYGVKAMSAAERRQHFPGVNFMADEVLGAWWVGQAAPVPVELSEVTFPALGERPARTVRYVGVTARDGEDRAELVGTFDDLTAVLGDLVHRPTP